MAFDASVLCRALLNPRSLEYVLLARAADGVPFSGFVTEVAGMGFVATRTRGSRSAVNDGCSHSRCRAVTRRLLPLFDAEHIRDSSLGRTLTPNHALHDMPLGQVVYEMTGGAGQISWARWSRSKPWRRGEAFSTSTHSTSVASSPPSSTARRTSCTSNSTDFSMKSIGNIAIGTPRGVADEFGLR